MIHGHVTEDAKECHQSGMPLQVNVLEGMGEVTKTGTSCALKEGKWIVTLFLSASVE